jgi:hypothetical protein
MSKLEVWGKDGNASMTSSSKPFASVNNKELSDRGDVPLFTLAGKRITFDLGSRFLI